MYIFVDLLAWATLIVGIFIVRKRVKKKVFGVAIIVLAFIVVGVLSLKINNSLLYATPEDAMQYLFRGEIVDVIDGQDSCCVVTRKSDFSYEITPLRKVESKYRLLGADEKKHETINADSGEFIIILSVEGTKDQYAYGTFTKTADNGIEIKDSNGTVFRNVVTDTGYSMDAVFAYAYIGQVDDNYEVHVTYAS